ncbi:cytochrome P450 2D6-like [Tiliqua scincoides]|uniref:cytochrome P450 2D6-like n=1 Tax=Tiliqua scincoides TaxID=71010 RepID=UPI003461D135
MNLMDMMPTSISWLWARISPGWINLPTQVLSLLLLALLVDYMKRRKRCPRYPPGPAPLPFIGNLLLMDVKNPHHTVQHLAKKFGKVMSVQIGWNNYVVLNGFKMTKLLLERIEDFADRPPVPLLKLMGRTRNSGGFFMASYSNGWKQQRRFLVSTLKKLGMGKKTLEKRVSEEAEYLCSEFKSKEGSPFKPQMIVSNATGNIMCILIFGDRFEYNDEAFLKLMHLAEEVVKAASRNIPQMMSQISWLSYIPGPHQKLGKLYNELAAILREIVNEHKNTRDPTFARDFIDGFLEEMEKAKGDPESSFNEQNLINVLFDLFAAGTETTTSTILWGLLFMVLYPEVQNKVHEEIDNVIGRHKLPMMEDQPKLPYTTAVIQEVLRYADLVPVPTPSVAHRDVEIDDFVVPKGTMVFYHLSSVLKDETMWEKPHQFYPEHFLDANGQLVKREAFLPFFAGPHGCPGEQLAKMELFIFFTSLLQHFTFSIPENSPRPKEEKQFALTISPVPFEICALPK